MKLSSETLNVLKNFSSINSGLFFREGSKLSTISQNKTVLAQATVTESFPTDFGIYDLNEFLSVLSLNKDPELSFDGVNVRITSQDGESRIDYRCTERTMIVTPPEKNINFPSVHISFVLSEAKLNSLMKQANVLTSPNVAVEGVDGKLLLVTYDSANDSATKGSINVGETDKTFRFVFKTDNLKMIPGSYDVEISPNGISHFKNKNVAVEYWITTEKIGNKV